MKLQDIFNENRVIDLSTLKGDQELVRQIQIRLEDLGLLIPSNIDGIWGPMTEEALTRFCDALDLDNMRTGKFGKTFAEKLIETTELPGVPDDDLDGLPLTDALATALKFTLKWEGGCVNHPLDPGGRTNRGVTQRVYNSFRGLKGLPIRDVCTSSLEETREIYESSYWKPSKAELMVLPMAVVQFDAAVLFGVGGAVRFLQKALGVDVDGGFGPQTQGALQAKNNKNTAMKMIDERIAHHHRRVQQKPSQRVFLQGWLNRSNDLRNFINNM